MSNAASSSKRPSYLAAAFNARPFGMPIPPNWFALAAVGLLGAFNNPGLWLIGAGLEGFYLWTLSRNPRFRAVVDAQHLGASDWSVRYESLLPRRAAGARRSHEAIERQATELADLLTRSGANPSQITDVHQMVWLHLKLLAARGAFVQVIGAAAREREALDEQAARLTARIERADRRRAAPQPRATARRHRIAPRGARRCRAAPRAGRRRARAPAPADRPGQGAGAAGHRRGHRGLVARRAGRLAQRSQQVAQDQRELFAASTT
jgi:hypothetical protein